MIVRTRAVDERQHALGRGRSGFVGQRMRRLRHLDAAGPQGALTAAGHDEPADGDLGGVRGLHRGGHDRRRLPCPDDDEAPTRGGRQAAP